MERRLDAAFEGLAAVGGRFASDDLVTVMAGGNDVFMQLAAVSATVAAGGDAATDYRRELNLDEAIAAFREKRPPVYKE